MLATRSVGLLGGRHAYWSGLCKRGGLDDQHDWRCHNVGVVEQQAAKYIHGAASLPLLE